MGKNRKKNRKERFFKQISLPEESKNYISGVVVFLIAIVISLSFFEKAGIAGQAIFEGLTILFGKVVFFLPLILVLMALVFFFTKYQRFFLPLILASFLLIVGISGVLNCLNPEVKRGGWLGYFFSLPLLKFFGLWVAQIIFLGIILIGSLIFWNLLGSHRFLERPEEKESLVKRIFRKVVGLPRLKIKEVPAITFEKEAKVIKEPPLELKTKPLEIPSLEEEYQMPPLDLLESERGQPSAGDIGQNSAIIKKTLESFEIPVEMSEVNVGPTVTQYTLKPADGIKLSKITTLSNDLALTLASHPIRIEAPIPGKSLVGIEVPNKVRTQVRLRDLIQNPQFQKAFSNLTFCLGRNVSGNPVYADLERMPHLLVAGATGTGKTIFLNSLIISLIYRNSPRTLRFILIDPKRVEFPVYNELPHLLAPVIYDAQKAINAFHWLIEEMERRFEILAESKTRDIRSYNEITSQNPDMEIMSYIVLIIDELADLMAARGREVEVGIVRLAQMARAVGIHLILATQRPSVEVITGLIKANITSRVTFQVASQVDSRTVFDMAGAEKLLGLGDMLFISAEITKPRRIQGAFVLEKEVKRVVNWLKSKVKSEKLKGAEEILENTLAKDLEKSLEEPEKEFESFYGEEDPLYEEAKRIVLSARKASASFLQRKLRIGYARAARLLDILEGRGIVGPGEGAKPREILIKFPEEAKEEDDEGWQKL